MPKADLEFKQSQKIKGMTSSLSGGACFAYALEWLNAMLDGKESFKKSIQYMDVWGNVRALLAYGEGHVTFVVGNNKQIVEFGKRYFPFMEFKGNFIDFDVTPKVGAYAPFAKNMSMLIGAMEGILITFNLSRGAHAIAISKSSLDQKKWGLFDPNFGVFLCDSTKTLEAELESLLLYYKAKNLLGTGVTGEKTYEIDL